MDFRQTWYVHWYCGDLVWDQILMDLSARDMPIFWLQDDNLSKCQGILNKLDTHIDIKEVWFGIANGQISSNFDGVFCPRHAIFWFPDNNLSKCQRILTKFGTCIDIKKIWFAIANEQISSIFDRVICLQHNNGGVLLFYFFISFRIKLWKKTSFQRMSKAQ